MRLFCVVLLVAIACGDDDGGADGGEGGTLCVTDCDDGVFCNGVERCDPGAGDALGCVEGAPPCTTTCDEAGRRCAEDCRDADGDGQSDHLCGGEDCDDANPNRFAGAAEICDVDGIDEDCDPSTFGPDADRDGYQDAACCNLQSDGALRCGADCDDSSSDVNPEIVDVCGNGDEDCDGTVDEDPSQLFYRDADGDGFGVPDDTILACAAGGGYVLRDTDCDDDLATINPGAPERCTAALVDEDCDGAENEGCMCSSGSSRACAGSSVGLCTPGTQQCIAVGGGFEWSVCVDRVIAESELCDSLDNDCDGDIDEDFECAPGQMETGTNLCGMAGCERQCNGDLCQWRTADFSCPETAASCNYCDDTGRGPADEIAFASGSFEFAFIDDMPVFLGDATTEASNTTLAIHNDPAPRVGGAFTPVTQPLGYGGALFDIIMQSNQPAGAMLPRGDGWAMVALVDQGALTLGPGGPALGVSRDHDGFSVEWRRYQEREPLTTTDSLVIRRLSATGIDPVIVRVPSPRSFTPFKDHVELVIMPDRPGTPEDETAVSVRFFSAGAWSAVTGCSSSTTGCGLTIPAGTPMRFGLTAAVGVGRQETYFYRTRVVDGMDEIPRLTITGLCP